VKSLLRAVICILTMSAVPAFATIFSIVRGVVHDEQHRPVSGATVSIKARQSEWTQSTKSDANGAFQISAVPAGEYVVTVALSGFTTVEQSITVVSNTTPTLHFQLDVAR